MVKNKNKNKKKIPIPARIIYFFIGVTIASILIIYSFRWEDLPFTLSFFGVDQTRYLFAPFVVLVGVLASSFTKSAFVGETELDS